MKILSTFAFICLLKFALGQSRKEQIEHLTFQVDSLNIIVNQLNVNISQLQIQRNEWADEKKRLDKDNSSLKKSLNEQESAIKSLNLMIQQKEINKKILKDSLQMLKNNNILMPLLKTATFAGSYSFQYDDGPFGSLQMYFDGKEDYYFSLDYTKGPPSYNAGELQGIIKIFGNIGVFNARLYDEDSCKIIFIFDDYGVYVRQLSECPFGYNVTIREFYLRDEWENKLIESSEYSSGFIRSTNRW